MAFNSKCIQGSSPESPNFYFPGRLSARLLLPPAALHLLLAASARR